MSSHRIYPVPSHQLGAQYVSRFFPTDSIAAVSGVHFALRSPEAEKVVLCLFDREGREEQVEISTCHNQVWSVFVEDLKPGQRYGYRIHGPWNPVEGQRFNPAKLLIDPYARKLEGDIHWGAALYDYHKGEYDQWLVNDIDSAGSVPWSVVVDDDFDWGGVQAPGHRMSESVIYELNVRGFTMQHPEVPEHLRGTYLGLCHPAVIDYLKQLGITAVELLPVTSMASEPRLAKLGLKNYWGYNPLAMMAPEASLALENPVKELKTMVKCLHEAGIEVIMDIVFNHTAEAGSDGPVLSFRGIDNRGYYLLDERNPLHSINHSGCGNTLKVENPAVLKLVTDAMRVWVEEYNIDGFRFDLAPVLGRHDHHFDPSSAFFQTVYQDPVLSDIKLIAEPWDLAHDGYQLGNFPVSWSEWNDRYRDCVRAFWRGDHGLLGQLAERISGSSDIFRGRGRSPSSSINYICSHDGFTLYDLVAYSHKQNQTNGEENRDGDNHNFSWNCGAEGETDESVINELRERYKRSLMTTLFLSNGAVMFQAGDEFGNSQGGNNNAYCQDSPVGWLDWGWLNRLTEADRRKADFQLFCTQLIRARRNQHAFTRDTFLKGIEEDPDNFEVLWRNIHGHLMTPGDWHNPKNQMLTLHLNGDLVEPCGCNFLILFNASTSRQRFVLPEPVGLRGRLIAFNTAEQQSFQAKPLASPEECFVDSHSVVILQDYCQPECPSRRAPLQSG
ncbi:MAG: glycogen debranching protein GlgX [Endozoicomonas sp.]